MPHPHVDILAVGAHPDDVELICAGLLLNAKRRGARIGVIDLTRGELGTRGTPETRAAEAARAAEVLGLDHRENLGLPDGNIRNDRDSIVRLADAIRRLRPRMLLGHYWVDHHPDHINAAYLVRDAWWFSGVAKFTDRPAHRPERLLHFASRYDVPPSAIVDISAVFAIKRAAAACYHSQLHRGDSDEEPETFTSTPHFFEHWEGKHRHLGAQIGVRFAEAYLLPTPVPVFNPLDLLDQGAT